MNQQSQFSQNGRRQDYPGLTRNSLGFPDASLFKLTFAWRRSLMPVVLLCVMTPTSFLLLHILQAQGVSSSSSSRSVKEGAGTFSIVTSMDHRIALVPTFPFSLDSMCIGVILISLLGLYGVSKGSRRMMNLYFACVVLFIVIQGLFAIRGFLSSGIWVQNVLDLSWSAAYESNPELIKDLQMEFNCQGFRDQSDRSLELPLAADEHLPPCSEVLELGFGKRLQRLALIILCIRMIQLAGVLLLSILFKYLAAMDREEQNLDEKQEFTTSWSTKKKEYFLDANQEDANACVPLLSIEETDEDTCEDALPQYCIQHTYIDDESRSQNEICGDNDGCLNLPDYDEGEQGIVSVYVA